MNQAAQFVAATIVGMLQACSSQVKDCTDLSYSLPSTLNTVEPVTLAPLAASEYARASDALGTLGVYHEVVRAPQAANLQAGGTLLLLGFEKPRAKNLHRPYRVGGDGASELPNFDPERLLGLPERARREVGQLLDDPRPFWLTHAVDFDGSGSACFVFNRYHSESLCAGGTHAEPLDPAAGWKAIYQLAPLLRERIARADPTHVFLLSTGWNTYQEESLLNYSTWMSDIDIAMRARATDFRPLYVAVSWQSTWSKRLQGASVVNKGNDADEVGASWVNVFLNEVLIPEAAGRPVVLIGHSYGARVVGSAAYLAGLSEGTSSHLTTRPLAYIGFAAAYPARRFVASAGKEPMYVDASVGPVATVVVASRHDQATSRRFIRYAGGEAGFEMAAAGSLPGVSSQTANVDGTLSQEVTRGPQIVDGSAFVNCHVPGTGGGAHSDVFTPQAAALVADVIVRAAVLD